MIGGDTVILLRKNCWDRDQIGDIGECKIKDISFAMCWRCNKLGKAMAENKVTKRSVETDELDRVGQMI